MYKRLMGGVGEDNSLSYVSHLKKKKIKQIGNLLMGLPVTGVFFFGVLWFIIRRKCLFMLHTYCCWSNPACVFRAAITDYSVRPCVSVSVHPIVHPYIRLHGFNNQIYIFFELINRING